MQIALCVGSLELILLRVVKEFHMRIGYYIPGWPPGKVPNGIVTTLGYLGQNLRKLGHEVFYITPIAASEFNDPNVLVLNPVRSLSEKLLFRWNFEAAQYRSYSRTVAEAVCRLVREHGIQVFQMEETQGWASTVIQQAAIPVVVRLHGPWFIQHDLGHEAAGDRENLHRVSREGAAILKAAAITAPSKAVLSITSARYGDITAPKRVIPNPMEVKAPALRWNLETADKNLILFVGRFDRIKGADILLTSFAKLAEKRPELKLLFVGPDSGLAVEGRGVVKFDEFCSEIPASLRSRIEFRGLLSRSEIENLRTRAYVTVVTSRYETFANVVIEAMSFGCPIVTTDVGGIPEIIVEKRNGLLVPSESVEGLTSALTEILDDTSLAEKLGAQAAMDCEARFTPMTVAQDTVEFYASVIESRRLQSS